MATDVLDLDLLIPPVKKIRIKGKDYDCHPLTIRQLIGIVGLKNKLAEVEDENELDKIIRSAIGPFIPAYESGEIDLTLEQLDAIIKYAQAVSIPEAATEARKYDTEKKIPSPEGSPTSSDSTPGTQ